MKLSDFALLSIAALCGAQDVPFEQSDGVASMPNLNETIDAFVDADFDYHVSPCIWTYELDSDVMDDSTIFAQVEEAFIQSANEAHEINDIRFEGVRIKNVIHEEVGDDEDEDDLSSEAELNFAQAIIAGILSPNVNGETPASSLRGKSKWSSRKFRFRGYTAVSYGCRLCGGGKKGKDDDAFMTSAAPVMTNDYYLTGEGRGVVMNWEKLFCKKLKKFKQMKHPNRCFIRMDFDHDESSNEEDFLADHAEN